MRIPKRRALITATIPIFAASVVAICTLVPSAPAQAIIVFDPSNYSQNVLTAARTLSQINNQIRSLQNQAQSLINQAKNLSTVSFPEMQAITLRLQEIDRRMGQAQGIRFRVADLDRQFRQLYPGTFDRALTGNAHVVDARARLGASVAAFRQTMTVQAQVAENVAADAATLGGIVARSQGAEGSLQVSQATNQLLALSTKQQFQIQTLMAAQYRAEAMEQARRVQAESDARAATAKFLESGSAYTSQ